jgi:hypothetical protein
MEELQDAIEDAQYVNAIATQDNGPRPVLPWQKPTDEQLQEWIATKDPQLDDFDWVLTHAIGYFLFSQYVKTATTTTSSSSPTSINHKESEYTRINFCEEMQRFLKLPVKARTDPASYLMNGFLETKRTSDPSTTTMYSSNNKTEITETDLARSMIPRQQQLTAVEIEKLLEINMDWPNCSESVVGLKGPVLKEVRQELMDLQDRHKHQALKRGSMRDPSSPSLAMAYSSNNNNGRTDECSPPNHVGIPLKSMLEKAQSTSDDEPTEQVPSVSTPGPPLDASAADDLAQPPPPPPPPPSSPSPSSLPGTPTTARKDRTLAASMHELAGRQQRLGKRTCLRRTSSTITHTDADQVFLQAEQVVMESLKRDYWTGFRESPLFVKFRNFLWYRDRRVVPEDFFTMRVLGRGGFGLVYGELRSFSDRS